MSRVLTFGVFDYFHLGHLRLFKQCRAYGDYLIVAVQDGDFVLKYKPNAQVLYSTRERLEIVGALKLVDEVMLYVSPDAETLSKVDFDVLALGEDQRDERFNGAAEWCKAHGKTVVRLKRTEGISSTEIKRRLI